MDWKLAKRYPIPEEKEEATSRVEGMIIQHKQPHTSWVGIPTDWKLTITETHLQE